MSIGYGVSEIRATNRFRILIILISIAIGFGVAINRDFLSMAIVTMVLIAFLRGYAKLCLHLATSLRIYIPRSIGYEGDRIDIDIAIENPSYIPIAFLEISINYSQFLRLVDGSRAALLLIPPRGRVFIKLVFLARLGSHRIGPIRAIVRDPLGLYRSNEIVLGRESYIEVYPRVSEVVVRRLLLFTRSTGVVRSRRRGSGIEIYGIREYTPYDDVRRIVWKYYASRRKLVVRETERETMQNILFILDATPPMFAGPYGYTPFEHCSRVIASIARYLAYRGDIMNIAIFTKTYIKMLPKFVRGVQGYRSILEQMRMIDYDIESIADDMRALRMEEVFRKTIPLLPRERSLILIFTSAGGDIYRDTLTRYANIIRDMLNEIYIIIPITTIYEIKGLPEWGQAIFRVKTYEAMKREIEFAHRLRSMGINVIAAGPHHIPQLIVSIIEARRY